jgi:hypothetical protein
MLTKRRLLELGFIEMRQQENWYMVKDQFCLVPESGVWELGTIIGGQVAVAPGGIPTYIETEEQLLRILNN